MGEKSTLRIPTFPPISTFTYKAPHIFKYPFSRIPLAIFKFHANFWLN